MLKSLKFAVLAFGLLGLIASFLPMVSFGDLSQSFWDTRKGPDGVQTYLTMAGFALAAVMGVLGVLQGLKRPFAIASLAGFGFVLLKTRGVLFDLLKLGIGAKLIVVAMAGGLLVSVVALATAEGDK